MDRRWHPNVLEHRLTHPDTLPMLMDFKKAGIAYRQGWIDELAELDAQIAAAVVRRRELAEKINISGRALTGTGRYKETPERRAFIPRAKPPFVDPVVVAGAGGAGGGGVAAGAAVAGDGAGPLNEAARLHGRALRDACNAVLRTTGVALTPTDIARLLGAHGHHVEPPHTRTIPNALRTDVRAGRVRRVARGLYQAVPNDRGDHAADDPARQVDMTRDSGEG